MHDDDDSHRSDVLDGGAGLAEEAFAEEPDDEDEEDDLAGELE